MIDIRASELEVEVLVAEGRKAEAVDLLYQTILACCAHAGNFSDADRLHDRLVEINPMALSEIINSAEAIDLAKTRGIDSVHRELWSDLYKIFFSNEERNAFYYALKQISVEADTEIISQGKLNNRLFFVNRGQMKVMIRQGNRETYLKSIGAGEVVGADTFFSVSVCTVSVAAETPVSLSVLERKGLEAIEPGNVGIEGKIEDYCRKHEKNRVQDILDRRALERRDFKRYKAEGKVRAQIVDKDDLPVGGAFNGLVVDVSGGGVLFMIKCSQKPMARALLGRRGLFHIVFDRDGQQFEMTKQALILGVIFHLFNDYSVHIRFKQALDAAELKNVLMLASSGS
jgi:pentatricopeptide repeat protein